MMKKSFKLNRYKLLKVIVCFFSVICLSFGSLVVFADSSNPTVYYANISQPQLTGNDCYLEIVTANDWRLVIYVRAVFSSESDSEYIYRSDISFNAIIEDGYLKIFTSDYGLQNVIYGWYYDLNWGSVGNLGSIDSSGSYPDYVRLYLGNSGDIICIHAYNCSFSSDSTLSTLSSDFVFSYGMDTVFNNKIDSIISALEQNKSSAEKNTYSGTTSEQNQAQSDLQSSEDKIYEDTAEYRDSTISVFKNFKIVDSIANGMLAVTSLFNVVTVRLSIASPLLQFSLAIGLGAFLLGVSSIVFKLFKK